ncbi:Flavin carrier protein 2 [Escovopsis weberi]|uniref:Flavin carrier protein 2 n=1 Tax=Escovopsis weberi TaxID=150374 RepID=A0A0M8N425_ESCWE|nr:Flavin carrier protein 2 [Escovopsis weberi]
MWLSTRTPLLLLASLATIPAWVSAASDSRMLISNSLNACQQNSNLQASLFNLVYTPHNNSASINMVATSSVQGKVHFDISASAYGYTFLRQTVDPCDINLAGLCPMVSGKISFGFNLPVSPEAATKIPGIAYMIPDLDANVRIYVNLTNTGQSVACVEADISNGKTVNLIGVKWATAIIAGLALISSAIVNGLGNANTAAHVAANSLSLFGYFQAQAIIGLSGIPLPPIVQAWTQDFQWSMGIIRIRFMQDILTWYQRATGGQPSTIFDSLTTISVQVEKRSLQVAEASLSLFKRGLAMMPKGAVDAIVKRGNIQTGSGSYVVYGIQRVAFKAGIESTNLFMTGLVFFWLFALFTALGIVAFKGLLEFFVRTAHLKSDKFLEFRKSWLTVLKGILFRVALIGLPQISILCLWEFTQTDSSAEVVLAVVFFFGLTTTLAWGAGKVIRIARQSVAMHRNPAYILFSDPQALNKWGFLYVQFRASAFYYIIPVLVYTLLKSMFVALAQRTPIAQAVGFIILEAAALISASILRPWMDKSTNSFNIAICVINFLNSIFLLIFTNVFGAPKLVVGVVGVILFILNAAFALILLLMVIVSAVISFFRRNPDARYQYMADDRASFMKSQTQLATTTELDALAATARGDKSGYGQGRMDLDDDNESLSSDDMRQRVASPYGPSASSSSHFSQRPRSPVNPSMPLFPADGQHNMQEAFRPGPSNPYNGSGAPTSPAGSRPNDLSLLGSGYRPQNTTR